MRSQPTPSVAPQDVERIVRRDFPPEDFDTVISVLKQYGIEKWQRECARVQLAALKLAAGNLKRLQMHIDAAKIDYRDVLAPAEFPEYSRTGFRTRELPAHEQEKIIDSDWKQYEDWFRR